MVVMGQCEGIIPSVPLRLTLMGYQPNRAKVGMMTTSPTSKHPVTATPKTAGQEASRAAFRRAWGIAQGVGGNPSIYILLIASPGTKRLKAITAL